jgi:hypothetical protein
VQGAAAAQAGVSVIQPNVGRLDDWYNRHPGVIRDPKVLCNAFPCFAAPRRALLLRAVRCRAVPPVTGRALARLKRLACGGPRQPALLPGRPAG